MKFLLLVAGLARLAGQTAAPVVYPLELHSGDAFPRGDHGYVFFCSKGSGENHPFTAYRPDGSLAYRISLTGAVLDAAFEADGSAAAVLAPGADTALVLLNSEGSVISKLVLSPFRPARVAFGPDHTFWILGSPGTKGGGIVGHYSRDGALLASFLDRPSISDSGGRAGPAYLGVSQDSRWGFGVNGSALMLANSTVPLRVVTLMPGH